MDRVSLDDQGRVLIPATITDRLGLSPGMTLVVEKTDTGDMRLRVESEPPVLVDKGGVLVAQVESFGDLTGVARRERDRRVFDGNRRRCDL
jgi:AbrB family looped-hinge helix DNA binding protein